jgi:hypothetical protein
MNRSNAKPVCLQTQESVRDYPRPPRLAPAGVAAALECTVGGAKVTPYFTFRNGIGAPA